MRPEVQQLIDNYYDKDRHIFNYFKNYMSCYIHLDDVVVIGPLHEEPREWSGAHIFESMICVDMFIKGGGSYRHVIKEGRDIEITQIDWNFYEALVECWKQCKEIKPE